MDPVAKTPMLVASTGETYNNSIAEPKLRERELRDSISKESQDLNPKAEIVNDSEVNYFKSAQWWVLNAYKTRVSNDAQVARWNYPLDIQCRRYNPILYSPSNSSR